MINLLLPLLILSRSQKFNVFIYSSYVAAMQVRIPCRRMLTLTEYYLLPWSRNFRFLMTVTRLHCFPPKTELQRHLLWIIWCIVPTALTPRSTVIKKVALVEQRSRGSKKRFGSVASTPVEDRFLRGGKRLNCNCNMLLMRKTYMMLKDIVYCFRRL